MVIVTPQPLDADARTRLVERPVRTDAPDRPGDPGSVGAPGLVTIRKAGVSDIPAIARITQEGPPPEDIEPEMMSRATRVLLTLVALEHGALWVEQAADGSILRAVTAIPASQLPPRPAVMRDLAHELGMLTPPHRGAAELGKELLAALTAIAPGWVLIEISRAIPSRTADPALLGAALAWTRAQPVPGPAPVMVLADSFLEREAAVALGFVEHRTWGHGWPWWLGVAPPMTPAPPA
ncbi:hypothetical protein [Pengzhenrongella frigida]|uniref:N-acetyltransferase n=1 Tax=Pengzhenrongella frigida TaxID=1259133 RepID=A0A4Q5MXV4_9MICO|nr:hypothetical protein [Cellulomonas sp. HLT2-17]RYV50426.1 hypothetical protein EUA98_13725 [Cellulomonas sp. HLT2-17]